MKYDELIYEQKLGLYFNCSSRDKSCKVSNCKSCIHLEVRDDE